MKGSFQQHFEILGEEVVGDELVSGEDMMEFSMLNGNTGRAATEESKERKSDVILGTHP